MRRFARPTQALTAAIAWTALAIQFALVIEGSSVLTTTHEPGLWLRIGRFACYFTVQSNLLVAISATWLAARPDADGRPFRAIRLAGLIGITVTGLVHYTLLRPLLELTGWSAVADTLLHVVVPIVAVAGWLIVGPRGRVGSSAIRDAFAWPLAWLAVTVLIGATTRWFPYPFLNWHEKGALAVVAVSAGIFCLAGALFAAAAWLDRRLSAL